MKIIHISDIHLTVPGEEMGGHDPHARFDRALDDGTLLTEAQRQAMWTPPSNADGTPSEYANGWFLQDYQGERLVFHSGWQPEACSVS